MSHQLTVLPTHDTGFSASLIACVVWLPKTGALGSYAATRSAWQGSAWAHSGCSSSTLCCSSPTAGWNQHSGSPRPDSSTSR